MTLHRPVLPLYYRVFKTLEQRMETQYYGLGSRLPSEEELCREFGVSRMTIRHAVGRLVEQGLVERRRGSGSYVVSAAAGRTVRSITLTGVLEDLFAQVERTQSGSATIAEQLPPVDVREAMGVPEGEPVTLVRRVRAFDDVPFALTLNYLPTSLGRRLRERDLARAPLLQILEEKLGVAFTHAEQTVEARLADEEVARALDARFGDPVLYVDRAMFAGASHPVEIVRSHYRADLYRYRIRLVRRERGAFAWGPAAGTHRSRT